ncbi:uncharacterized protein LOC128173813 isoform X1 [Crassostrea angulata]|uniref:uncharacterized protein LOC128173813 isoform X1 n=1 Tax=Magallana angulata TaxID=2784310 RepID=UPI0022B0E746|nr:uncharacterized protein LOC128173813 isoform X1 [Crassostrea angulata]
MWPMGLLLSMLLVWVLVVFLEEDVLSHPIRLEEVQDLIGRNGVEADLQERDECLARYYVGDQLRAALIYKRSENLEELKKEYEKVMEMIKQKPKEKSKFWRYSRVIGGGVLVGGLAVAAAPFALSAAGFSTGGIVAGSLAARLMSMAAIANGGGVAAASTGGWIAAFQSAGAAGISASTNFLIGSTAGTLGGFFASRFGKRSTSKQGKFPDKSEGLPTGNRTRPTDNETSSDPSLEESRKTTDLFVDIKQSNSLPTSKTESCSSLDSTDQNQDEEYLSADFQNISLNADEAEQLYRQNQQLQEEKQCKICLDSEMDTLFEPCGHLCTCRSCASMLRVCPICRKHIKKLHQVYRS